MLQYRIIESAPLPVKEKKERKPRQKYDFASIPVGGAAAFPVGEGDAKKLKASIYQSAAKFRKDNPGFQFRVSIEENGAEVWVRRLTDEIAPFAAQASTDTIISDEGNDGAPATAHSTAGDEVGLTATSTAETVTNGAYDYSLAAAE